MNKVKLVEILMRSRNHYDLYVEGWWVIGIDKNGRLWEGWESEFELP